MSKPLKNGAQLPTDYSIPSTSPGLSDAEIHRITLDIHEKCANADDARKLLQQFVFEAFHSNTVSRELVVYLRDAFAAYLQGAATLDVALGIKKGKGRPKADRATGVEWARSILDYRLRGETQERAIDEVASHYHKSSTPMAEAWRDYRDQALRDLTLERRSSGRMPVKAGRKVKRHRAALTTANPI